MGFFNSSRNKAWNELCEQVNGNFVKGGFWKGDWVEIRHSNWIIYLDTYTVSSGRSSHTYTRIRAPFIKKNDFYFKIYKKSILSNLGKALGMQDIQVGNEEFDNNYIIKGNDDYQVMQLFSNSKIRELISVQPSIELEIKNSEGIFGPTFNENEAELYFSEFGVLNEIYLLKNLYELFCCILDELELMGSVSGEAPSIQLYK